MYKRQHLIHLLNEYVEILQGKFALVRYLGVANGRRVGWSMRADEDDHHRNTKVESRPFECQGRSSTEKKQLLNIIVSVDAIDG